MKPEAMLEQTVPKPASPKALIDAVEAMSIAWVRQFPITDGEVTITTTKKHIFIRWTALKKTPRPAHKSGLVLL